MNNVDNYINKNKFTPRGLELINFAMEESKKMKHTYVGLVHFEYAMKKMKEKCSPEIFESYE